MGTDVFTGQYFFDWGKILIQVCGLYFQITNIFVMLTREITFPLVMISEPICHLLTLNLKKGMLYCWLGMDLQALRILPCMLHQKPLVLAIPWVPLTASRSFMICTRVLQSTQSTDPHDFSCFIVIFEPLPYVSRAVLSWCPLKTSCHSEMRTPWYCFSKQ